jgi:hypothetical protein
MDMSAYTIAPAAPDDQGLTLVNLSGNADAESILGLLAELSTRAEHDPSLRVLMDENGLRPGLIMPSDIQRIIGAWRKATALHTTRVAVFASNLAIYGLNRMFQGLAGRDAEGRVRIFNDQPSARRWLLDASSMPEEN